jgi:transcriptional regulator with XRE-family HTH domain
MMLPFGETILAWRLERRMTQAQLAKAAGIPRPNLSAIERGDREVTLRTLRALAIALGVRPGVLADGASPGQGAPPLARAALERIAAAAHAGDDLSGLSDPREARTASRLREVTRAWPGGGRRPRTRSRTRAIERAYFLLKTSESPETIASLVGRMSDRRGRG